MTMLTATEARKASVHGRFLKPSTKRSEVVNPTSNRPPTISHNQGMTILSLDDARCFVTFPPHEEAGHHRQQDRASALPAVHDHPARRDPRRRLADPQLVAWDDGRFQYRCHRLP